MPNAGSLQNDAKSYSHPAYSLRHTLGAVKSLAGHRMITRLTTQIRLALERLAVLPGETRVDDSTSLGKARLQFGKR